MPESNLQPGWGWEPRRNILFVENSRSIRHQAQILGFSLLPVSFLPAASATAQSLLDLADKLYSVSPWALCLTTPASGQAVTDSHMGLASWQTRNSVQNCSEEGRKLTFLNDGESNRLFDSASVVTRAAILLTKQGKWVGEPALQLTCHRVLRALTITVCLVSLSTAAYVTAGEYRPGGCYCPWHSSGLQSRGL